MRLSSVLAEFLGFEGLKFPWRFHSNLGYLTIGYERTVPQCAISTKRRAAIAADKPFGASVKYVM